jgi:serine/threonine protein kinase
VPGDKLGKYDLIRQIAVGGMAELYLARTVGIEGFEKLCVVKRILPQYADDQSFVTMFLNEARLAATLHHPNIAQVYDIGQEAGDYFFSMEYVHGEDLGRLASSAAQDGVPVSLDAALTLVAGLCAGLHYAHEKASPDGRPLHVVHRDVSPSNVLVSYDGAVKLVDFGIARQSSGVISTSGGLKGKIAYMSPEQCRGRGGGTVDRRSDIFSVGTLLYELTTSQLPFQAPTDFGVLEQIVTGSPVPPSTVVPGYPPALEAIVMRALARDQDQRYPTALALQGDIEDFAHENRLRVSPLVLARLMSNLFPARLEEWAHARAQGAFFVEQHVVRTLIESGKTGEHPPMADGAPQAVPPAEAPADDDTTGVMSVPEPPGAITTTMNIVAPPPLASLPLPPPRKSEPQLRQGPTAVGLIPTPVPRLSPVPNMPGAVPIVTGPPARPTPTPPPHALGSGATATPPLEPDPGSSLAPMRGGTLVSNNATPYGGVPIARPLGVGDVTEHIRVPPRRHRTAMIAILAVAGFAAAMALVVFIAGNKDDGDSSSEKTDQTAKTEKVEKPEKSGKPETPEKSENAGATPPAVMKDEVKTPPVDVPSESNEPALEWTHEDTHELRAPEIKPEPRAEPKEAKADEPAKVAPKKLTREPPKPRIVRTPPPPKKKPPAAETEPKSSEPKKEEPKYNADSPFMPVRPDGKKENK